MPNSLNPFDPDTQHDAAVAWAEQLDAGVKDVSRNLLEDALHKRGLCCESLPEPMVLWLDVALEIGAVGMGMELMRLDRIKE